MSNTYSLYDLHKYVKQVFALNFSDSIWIHAEISQAKEVRGQVYIDLIEKSENSDDVIAQANAIVQYKSALFLRKKLGTLYDSILQEGVAAKLKVKLEFHERYGYKLMIIDIDPSYTLGQVEMRRQEIIDRLDTEGLLYLNESLELPRVIQNIALITSETAAGYKDFIETLRHNQYGYKFKFDLYQTSMQGKNTERELVNSMNRIMSIKNSYDVVIIIRGGGAKIDLASFDHYNIGNSIAMSELPVICGIGHEIDNTVSDIVAHTSLKTPTAVAEFLINQCMSFESDIIELWRNQKDQITSRLYQLESSLNESLHTIKYIPQQRINHNKQQLIHLYNELESLVLRKIETRNNHLEHLDKVVQLSNPDHILKKGYVFVKREGNIISSKKQLRDKDRLEIKFHDGIQQVIVDSSN